VATFILLGVALVPLSRLREQEHHIDGTESPAYLGELPG
jgi:hypothetical protein